ncbi:MAG: hypothetical protein QM790_05185 [Nibricoccus sp.]
MKRVKSISFATLTALTALQAGCHYLLWAEGQTRSYAFDGVEVTKNDIDQIVIGTTTQAEVISLLEHNGLNKPTWYWPEFRTRVYTWLVVSGPRSGHPDIRLRSGLKYYLSYREEARGLCVCFDKGGRVSACSLLVAATREDLEKRARRWAAVAARVSENQYP